MQHGQVTSLTMPPRKRTHAEMEASEPSQEKKEPSLLQKIRNMWEFSAVMQYIYLFGKVVKIDEDFDVEVRSTPHPSRASCLSVVTRRCFDARND